MHEMKNAADENKVKADSNKSRMKQDQDVTDLCEILATVGGRRFVWRYLEACRVFSTSMTGNSYTYFNEGQRNIGLKLLSEVNSASPEALTIMMKEFKKGEL